MNYTLHIMPRRVDRAVDHIARRVDVVVLTRISQDITSNVDRH